MQRVFHFSHETALYVGAFRYITVNLVISNCSKRKRRPLDASLYGRDLIRGRTAAVAAQWIERLSAAPVTGRAADLYGGRAFVEACAAARSAKAELLIVSAGLGLISAEARIPAYSLTTVRGDPDCVLDKTDETAVAWWAAVQKDSPFRSDALDADDGLILVALPSAYLSMVAQSWENWPSSRLSRLRLFTKECPRDLPAAFQGAWMPYDDRLDAVDRDLQGTQGDFAQRAVRHFAFSIGQAGSAEAHRREVLAALEGLSARDVPVRRRMTDKEIVATIDAHWDDVGGRSSAMLRHLRHDLGVACEQSRFKDLFKVAADSRSLGRLM